MYIVQLHTNGTIVSLLFVDLSFGKVDDLVILRELDRRLYGRFRFLK